MLNHICKDCTRRGRDCEGLREPWTGCAMKTTETDYIFIPVYTNRYSVEKIKRSDARRLGRYIEARGTIYGDTAYNTEAAAWAYIRGDYHDAARDAATI